MIVTAVLKKLATDDGLCSFKEDQVWVGKRYRVYLDSVVENQLMLHYDEAGVRIPHRKTIIYADNGCWLPLECLEILAD